ncbi:adhesion G protein-coupled receptor E2-like isoform X2 [Hyperolius riggenbachi]
MACFDFDFCAYFLPRCPCMDGYSYNQSLQACTDIDECNSLGHNCGAHTRCENTDGSYFCTCEAGFHRAEVSDAEFCPSNEKTNNTCSDIDECAEEPEICGPNSSCENTLGSYTCSCLPGFKQNFSSCVDIDECAEEPEICGPNSSCGNTLGSYTCSCLPGFKQNSSSCVGDAVTQKCASGLSQKENQKKCNPQNPQDVMCSILQISYELMSNSCQSNNITKTNESTTKEFTRAADVITKALAKTDDSPTSVVNQGQTFKVLNNVETLTLKSFDDAPRTETISTSKLDIVMKVSSESCGPNVPFFTLMTAENSMEVPCDLVPGPKGGAILITYKDLASNLNGALLAKEDSGENRVGYVNSQVVSAAITSLKTENLTSPVTFKFAYLKPPVPFHKSTCVFWDSKRNGWSDKGCEVGNSNDLTTSCSCYHFSSFAVLMAPLGLQDYPELIISANIGLSISLLCLCLSLLTFILCRSLKSPHTSVLIVLCGCLFSGQLILLVGLRQTKRQVLCRLIAGSLHFLFLSAFCWMSIESCLLFMTVQNLRSVNYMASRRSNLPVMCLLGFGVPAVIVGISASIHPQGYSTREYCWLDLSLIWSFLGPACAFICTNTVLLVLTVWLLRKRLASLNTNVSSLKNTRLLTFKALAQAFILGCTWGIGFFQFGPFSVVMSYIFTICNSLQGVYIFLVHCVLNQQVRAEYHKFFYKQLKESTDISTSGFPLTNSTNPSNITVLSITRKRSDSSSTENKVSWT